MKNYFLLAILFIHVFIAEAQKLKVTAGPVLTPMEVLKQVKSPKLKPVRMSEIVPSGHFFDLASRRTFSSFSFSKNNLMCSENFITPAGYKAFSAEDTDIEEVSILNLLNHNNKLFIFYVKDNPKTNEFSVYVNEVSKDLVVMGTPILIHTFTNLKEDGSYLNFQSSANNKHFLLYRLIKTRAKEPQQFECAVINSGFGKVWNKRFELTTKDKYLTVQSAQLDDAGNFYLLGEKKEEADTQQVLYFYDHQAKSFKNFIMGIGEGYNFGTKLKIIDGTKPYIVGLNQQKKEVRYFSATIDITTGNLQNVSSALMPESFYKASNFNAYSTSHWNVTDLVALKNGNLVASVEANLVKTSNGVPIGYYTYYTYLFSFTPTGEQKFQHTVYKIQGSMGELVGHTLIPRDNKVYVLYNDHPNNLKVSPSSDKIEGYNGKQGLMMVQEIDENGKAIKYALSSDPGLTDFGFSIADFKKLGPDLYFSIGIKRKNMFSLNDRNLLLSFD